MRKLDAVINLGMVTGDRHVGVHRGRRTGTVEHSFGTIKAWMGTTHFLTRRLRNVKTEIALNVLAYNIMRMVALIGIRGLMAAVKA